MNDIYFVIVPIVSLLVCQLLKFLIEIIRTKKIDFNRLINGSGGIPSTHSALLSSITMLIGLSNNFKGEIFGLSLALLLVICYDAMGVRNEAEKHAILLNKISKSNLNEEIGHEPFEVLTGIILGSIIAIIFFII